MSQWVIWWKMRHEVDTRSSILDFEWFDRFIAKGNWDYSTCDHIVELWFIQMRATWNDRQKAPQVCSKMVGPSRAVHRSCGTCIEGCTGRVESYFQYGSTNLQMTTAVPNYSYPILQEGELSSWFRLMLNHSCSFMRCSSAGNCRGRIFVRTDHQPGRSLQQGHSTRRILWFPQILGKFYTIDSLLLAIVFVGRTDNISPSYVASQLGILRGSRSRGVSTGFKHKERIPGLHSAEEGVRQKLCKTFYSSWSVAHQK